ncbi:MAG: hypothetical protein RLZZ599_1419 [Bacteroidota bacterium]|jgi:galactose mutarotase-like enzyme
MGEHLLFENSFGAFTVASRGASLLSLQIDGRELLHDFGDQWQDWASGSVMFPFPVRMSSGSVMKFEGKEYHWPINDEKHRAALHGLTPWEKFELSETSCGIEATWTYDGSKDYYPFPCVLTINYSLEKSCLVLTSKVENLGDVHMPYHLGWHPYFKVGTVPTIEPSPNHRLVKNEVSHPGAKIPFHGFDWQKEVDGAFYMSEIHIVNHAYRLQIEPISAITQIFRPADAPFIAVEPITGLGHPEFAWRTVAPGCYDQAVSSIRLSWL